MIQFAEWLAMGTGVIAATVVSVNLGRRITGAGFVVFVVSSTSWVVVGLAQGEAPLTLMNIALTIINVVGVYRWLVLKANEPA